MNSVRTILLIFFAILAVKSVSQVPDQKALLRETAQKWGQAEIITPYPGRALANSISKKYSVSSYKNGYLNIVVNSIEVERFIESGIPFKVVLPDYPKESTTAASVIEALEWNSYPTYTQYDSIMRKFSNDYPQLCTLDTIGFSIYGKLVLVLKISDNAVSDEDEPEVFYTSTIHGDETGGFILMLRLADYLLKNYSTSPLAQQLVDNLEIYINPLSNPDGTYRTGNTISSPVRANASGRDLNRNFPDPGDPNDIIEKENVDMIKFMRGRSFILSANFHAGEEVVNYPWDRWVRLHADDEWFYYISRCYADTLHSYAPVTYFDGFDRGVTNGYQWYDITGGRQDFVTWELHGREVTIELDDTKWTPASQLESLWQYNYRSLLHYLENAVYGIHGTVIDDQSELPVGARVYINTYDKDSSQVYSDTVTGRFVRMLPQGSWDLTFSAGGYRDTTVSVIVTDRSKTDLEVRMEPLSSTPDTIITVLPLIWPVPGEGELNIVLPPGFVGSTEISLISPAGMILRVFNREVSESEKFILDLSGLSGGSYILKFRNKAVGRAAYAKIIIKGSGLN